MFLNTLLFFSCSRRTSLVSSLLLQNSTWFKYILIKRRSSKCETLKCIDLEKTVFELLHADKRPIIAFIICCGCWWIFFCQLTFHMFIRWLFDYVCNIMQNYFVIVNIFNWNMNHRWASEHCLDIWCKQFVLWGKGCFGFWFFSVTQCQFIYNMLEIFSICSTIS